MFVLVGLTITSAYSAVAVKEGESEVGSVA